MANDKYSQDERNLFLNNSEGRGVVGYFGRLSPNPSGDRLFVDG